jgi:hypothetical protein
VAPPPLDPPAPVEPAQRPSFLRTEEELRRAKASRPERERPRRVAVDDQALRAAEREQAALQKLPDDFVLRSSPWVDFSLTSFWMGERVGNFLNLGVQFGGYFVERLRLSGRLVVPLEEMRDDFSSTDDDALPVVGAFESVDSAHVSVLYSASFGIILARTKSFVFAPGVLVQRTDVNDYGTSVALQLPFDWTTRRHLRVGFELAIGHAFGGSVTRACRTVSAGLVVSCGQDEIDRPGGTSVLLQYNMGWSLGHL